MTDILRSFRRDRSEIKVVAGVPEDELRRLQEMDHFAETVYVPDVSFGAIHWRPNGETVSVVAFGHQLVPWTRWTRRAA
jgi:hypothetical protein